MWTFFLREWISKTKKKSQFYDNTVENNEIKNATVLQG